MNTLLHLLDHLYMKHHVRIVGLFIGGFGLIGLVRCS